MEVFPVSAKENFPPSAFPRTMTACAGPAHLIECFCLTCERCEEALLSSTGAASISRFLAQLLLQITSWVVRSQQEVSQMSDCEGRATML